jgi:hypothetical protein
MIEDLGLSNLQDVGVAIAIIIGAVALVVYGFKPVALAWLDTIRENNRQRHDAEQSRIAADTDQTKALRALEKRLEEDQQTRIAQMEALRAVSLAVGQLSAIMADSKMTMEGVTKEHITQLTLLRSNIQTVPDATRAALQDDFKAIPGYVWAEGDPRLDTFQRSIERQLDEIRTAILHAVEPSEGIIRAAVRFEVEHLCDQVDQMLTRMAELKDAVEHAYRTGGEETTTKAEEPDLAPPQAKTGAAESGEEIASHWKSLPVDQLSQESEE